MPYSESTFDKEIEEFIERYKFENYFDVGVGSGKYARIIREHFPDAKIIGIEAETSYIKEFELKKLYNEIRNQYIEKFIGENPDFTTDLVIIGDCIEHLKKSDGVDLLHYLVYRARYIIVVFPTQYIQYSWGGHQTEAHRSVWDKKDFIQFRHRYKKKGIMNMVVVRGFLGDSKTTYAPDHQIP